jgi:DNA invertase Pin-like site-specific DNA recombinase
MSEKAICYIRVSTEGQDQFSPGTQLKSCKEYAERHGLDFEDRVVQETESAWVAGKRPEYKAMIRQIRKEKIPHLVFFIPSRIARNLDDWLPLRDTGVRHHDVLHDTSFSPLSKNPEDRRRTRNFERELINATQSSDDNSDQVTKAWQTQASLGRFPHLPPLGYDPVKNLVGNELVKTIKQDPVRLPIIKRLFEYVISTGESNKMELARKARDMGLRSRTGRVRNSDETERTLRNPWYCGTIQIKGKLYPNKGNYQPIITQAEFEQVQEILGGKRAVRRGKYFPYKPLLVCGLCGHMLTGDEQIRQRKGGITRVYHYYHCQTKGCRLSKKPYITEQELDESFGASIEALDVDEGTYQAVKTELEDGYRLLKELNQSKVKSLDRELGELTKRGSYIIGRMAKVNANDDIEAALERELEAVARRTREVERELESAKTGAEAVAIEDVREVIEFSKSLKKIYLTASPEKRAKLNYLLFRTVEVLPEPTLLPTGGCEELLTEDRLYFHWKEPFMELERRGFIKGMAQAKKEPQGSGNPQETPENKSGAPGVNRTPDPLLRRQQDNLPN